MFAGIVARAAVIVLDRGGRTPDTRSRKGLAEHRHPDADDMAFETGCLNMVTLL